MGSAGVGVDRVDGSVAGERTGVGLAAGEAVNIRVCATVDVGSGDKVPHAQIENEINVIKKTNNNIFDTFIGSILCTSLNAQLNVHCLQGTK